MRFILIDPHTRTVTEGADPNLAYEKGESGTDRHLQTLYQLMDCSHVEWQNLGIKPAHDILMDEEAAFSDPQPPTFMIGEVHLVGKAIILGRRGRNNVSCSLPLARVTPHVRFDVGPKVFGKTVILGFDTSEDWKAHLATRRPPRWL